MNHQELYDKSIKIVNAIKGLNGYVGIDYVVNDNGITFMEINPRIPGSIRVSETVLNMNLLDLYIKSFDNSQWEIIKNSIIAAKHQVYATKLIMFAPKEINEIQIDKINKLKYVHDKTEKNKTISKEEPICTVLFKAKTFSESYFGALKIIDKIKEIIY